MRLAAELERKGASPRWDHAAASRELLTVAALFTLLGQLDGGSL